MTSSEARLCPPKDRAVHAYQSLRWSGGKTANDESSVQAQAIKISRAGATILLDADVALGSILKLTPPFGRPLDAEVNGVWTDAIDGRRRIGVKLLDTDGGLQTSFYRII